jgi:hypothetical protein
MDDRNTFSDAGDGGAGAIVAGLVVVVLLVVGFFYFFGAPQRGEIVDVSLPKLAAGVNTTAR